MKRMHFEIVHARGKQKFRAHIIAANGKKLFTSETYASRQAAWGAARLVNRWCRPDRVPIVDRTLKPA